MVNASYNYYYYNITEINYTYYYTDISTLLE